MPYQSRFFEQTVDAVLDRELLKNCRIIRPDKSPNAYRMFCQLEAKHKPLDVIGLSLQDQQSDENL
jgi:hypothetical protein